MVHRQVSNYVKIKFVKLTNLETSFVISIFYFTEKSLCHLSRNRPLSNYKSKTIKK